MHLVFSGLQFLYFLLGMNSCLIFIENGRLHKAAIVYAPSFFLVFSSFTLC